MAEGRLLKTFRRSFYLISRLSNLPVCFLFRSALVTCATKQTPAVGGQVEVIEAYKELVPHSISNEDRKEIQKLKDFPFSTQLTIYLMHKTKAKAGSPPGSMKYFRVALERLWADCSIAVAKAREETYSMTREQAFWKLNEAVLKEIDFWQRGLSRS